MKLELVALPGHRVDALFARERSKRDIELATRLSNRMFGTERVSYDAGLSYRWGCTVYCTPEFSTWWHHREGAPGSTDRIFLEVLPA